MISIFASRAPSSIRVRALAEQHGLHRNTVTARLRDLEEREMILPALLDVVPARIGLPSTRLYFAGIASDEVVRKSFLVEGVKDIMEYHEALSVLIVAEDSESLEGRARLLHALLSRRSTDRVDISPEPVAKITRRQATLLAELQGRPPGARVTSPGDGSDRTRRRDIETLEREGLLRLLPGGLQNGGAIREARYQATGDQPLWREGSRERLIVPTRAELPGTHAVRSWRMNEAYISWLRRVISRKLWPFRAVDRVARSLGESRA